MSSGDTTSTTTTASTTMMTISNVNGRVVTTTADGLQIAEDGEILGGLVPPNLVGAVGDDLSGVLGPVTCHDCGRSYSTVSHLKQVCFFFFFF